MPRRTGACGTANERITINPYYDGAALVTRLVVFEHGEHNDPSATVDLDALQSKVMLLDLLSAILDVTEGGECA